MRFSIVTACLLSVAAFARDNNHDMHASPVLSKLALKKVEGQADKAYAVSLKAKRPEGECLNWDAYNYISENEVCNDTWMDWDVACYMEYDEECYDVEE